MPLFQSSGQYNPPETCYGRLQHIISVTFPDGDGDLHLGKGATFAFALFHQCMLTQGDPRLDRLNIRFYSEECENLQITDVFRVHGLVGRVKELEGRDSWAIVDRYGRFSREAYLTQETS